MADGIELNSVELAAEITIAWLGNQNVRALPDDVPSFLRSLHATIEQLSGRAASSLDADTTSKQSPQHVPAVTVRKSLSSKDHIISLIDGKPYKTLRRHLSGHGLTPDQYRERYNLKADYPMTAPSYSEARRSMALKIGLGDKRRAAKSVSGAESPNDQSITPRPQRTGAGARQAPLKASGGKNRRVAAESPPKTTTPMPKRKRKSVKAGE